MLTQRRQKMQGCFTLDLASNVLYSSLVTTPWLTTCEGSNACFEMLTVAISWMCFERDAM